MSLSPEELAKLKQGNRRLMIGGIIAAVVVTLGLGFTLTVFDGTSTRDAGSIPTGKPTVKPGKVTIEIQDDLPPAYSYDGPKEWQPKGYELWEDGLAWRWANGDCGYGDYCWGMLVRSQYGCPDGLYAEINIEDNGVVIDYSNDSVGSLPAATAAKLEFRHFGDSGTLSGVLTELNCR